MAIQGKNIRATDKQGQAVNLEGNSGGGNFGDTHPFMPIPSAWYNAEVRGIKEATIRMSVSGAESDDADGKYNHLRLQPDFRIFNDNGTIISRQTYIVAAIDSEGNVLQPNPEKDAVWGGLRGARELLTAIKAFSADDDGGFNLLFHAPAIRGQVVRVMTSVGGYRTGAPKDILPNEMKAKLNEYSDEPIEFDENNFDLERMEAALKALNEAEGYTEENGYKFKNVVVKIVALWANKAEEEGFYVQHRDADGVAVPTGRIFVSEAAADAFEEAMEHANLSDDF
jgi:hypothetical protein